MKPALHEDILEVIQDALRGNGSVEQLRSVLSTNMGVLRDPTQQVCSHNHWLYPVAT